MDTIELINIDERHLEDWHRRVALVETLLGENIDEADRGG